jgi:hypothetical protein
LHALLTGSPSFASQGFSGCVPDEEALASVEIKTSVSEISSSVTVQNASADVKSCELGDETFRMLVPEAHMAHVIQQMVLYLPFLRFTYVRQRLELCFSW